MKYFLFFVIFALVAIPIYLIIKPIITEKYCRERLRSADPSDPELIPQLLRAFMPSGSVLTGISLPIPGKDGEEISYGTVAVNRAGIFIISRICNEGLLENPPGAGMWKLMTRGAVTEFPNPFKEQESPRRLLAYYANAAGVRDVKVHSLIVYTNGALRFSHPPSKGTIHASVLHTRLRKANAHGKLTARNLRAIIKTVKDVNAGIADISDA
ncbi:MAG: hypothetical protein IKB34_08440 [Clostridia bacterium]|nr:hypothetical protein [Clostridia bacterium]